MDLVVFYSGNNLLCNIHILLFFLECDNITNESVLQLHKSRVLHEAKCEVITRRLHNELAHADLDRPFTPHSAILFCDSIGKITKDVKNNKNVQQIPKGVTNQRFCAILLTLLETAHKKTMQLLMPTISLLSHQYILLMSKQEDGDI